DLRMLAVLAPQVERQAAKAGDMDATTATEMRKKANLYRGRTLVVGKQQLRHLGDSRLDVAEDGFELVLLQRVQALTVL
ncbi:hypothetical protein, partial [Nocardia cyriacigeorgica]